jgi:beta-glucanase (GH16 family)
MDWIKNLFGKKPKPPAPAPAPSFVADFTSGKIDPAVWNVSTWTAPGANASHKGNFAADHAFVENGVLCLALSQTKDAAGVVQSLGAELTSLKQFSYGTFEWVCRASSTAGTPNQAGVPVSGSITGCFLYRSQASTEIDVEVEGGVRRNLTQFTSWVGEANPNQTTQVSPTGQQPHETFFTYTFKWMPGKIEFYRDNVLVATHTKVVPSLPAAAMMNHWGTNDPNWGGPATLNSTRYMWVKSFKYTPLS